jgi:quercetin dioxygenase-like cupin family protein
MHVHDCLAIADNAVSTWAGRAATAIVHDSADARMVVFRLDAGDAVAMHTSTSTVILSVIRGTGIISGPAGGETGETGETQDVIVSAGTIVTYEPDELHGMSAPGGPFVVLATITPRPGGRRNAAA